MRLILAILLATSLATHADGKAPPASATNTRIELFGRELVFNLPTGFVRVTDKSNGTNVLIEYVPNGQTTANWTRMVTIQAYRGLGASPHPTSAIARQAFYPAACKIGPIYRDFGEQSLDGGIKRTIVANGCASLPAGAYPKALKGAGEQDFIMMFRDADTIYTLNYAERGSPFAGRTSPNDFTKAAELLSEQFGEVGLRLVR